MYIKIISKEIGYNLYESGEFGNKLRTWKSLYSLQEDCYEGTVTMRYASKYGKWCEYDIPQDGINIILTIWEIEGADRNKVRFNESAPDKHLIIQGEFVEDKDYRYILSYSADKVKMRVAMEFPKELLGFKALYLLQKHLSFESMRNMRRLLNTYPNAVVEFSAYDHFLGSTPKNNTVFWEVRNY